jgi:hypothetical protein
MMETWSAGTLTDSELEPHQVDQQIEYVIQALEPCSQRSAVIHAAEPAQSLRLPLFDRKVAGEDAYHAIDRFLVEDPSETPLTAYNLRVSAAIQAQVSLADHELSYRATYVLYVSLVWITEKVSSNMFDNDIAVHW